MAYELRPYQRAAVDGLWSYLAEKRGRAPLIVAPTGAGKSLILAAICREWLESDPRVQIVVATHVKELVEQNAEKLCSLIGPGAVGVHSAGLGRRDVDQRVIVGGVQSLVSRVEELGPRHVIIVDEAHRVPRDGEGQYRALLKALRARVLVGLTATPGRMDSGLLHEGEGAMFDGIAYEIEMVPLIKEGYLSPLKPLKTGVSFDLTGARIARGDFVLDELSAVLEDREKLKEALDVWRGAGRSRTLIFCASVAQAEMVMQELGDVRARLITGETKADDRAAWIAQYKAGELDALVNVMVLTTGFDAPETDCIVCFRPTASTGLYVQMMGRGSRVAPGKKDCLVLDFCSNVERHGPVSHPTWQKKKTGKDPLADGEPLVKECKSCGAQIALSATSCEFCGEPCPRQMKVDRTPSPLELIDMGEPCELRVVSQTPVLHHSASGNTCIRMDFWASHDPNERPLLYSAWYVVAGAENAVYMGRKALKRALGREFDEDPALALAQVEDELRWRADGSITVRRDGKYTKVLAWRPGQQVEPVLSDDDLPF